MAKIQYKHIVVLAVFLMTIIAPLIIPATVAEEETVKVTVIETTKFTNETYYMYDDVNKKLVDVNTSYVEILDYELRDKDPSDGYMPCVVLSIDPPTTDLNTNESIVYAWVLPSSYGDSLLVAVADINDTDKTVVNMEFYKISPVSGDIAVYRTAFDIVVVGPGYKLSIPLSNFSNPKVMLMSDSAVAVNSLSYIELRALRNPPSGYTLIRNGYGEAEFTISASGILYIWFDEEHDTGDLDLFIFDISDSDYGAASLQQTWTWLRWRCTSYIYADYAPETRSITATGTVKLIVKKYHYAGGDPAGVGWRIAARLVSSPSPEPEPTPPSTPLAPIPTASRMAARSPATWATCRLKPAAT